ncbi:Morn repeat incomplete domain containing protein [Pandoravirus macleodensis]|uniref:Morn repeat incomplete domain containing protein n=1 Tax=Pandoravirus macleodensis TaxID=2107707 RepID=A0A2U7UEY7_9VIRU|nr:Morn repeat incomplete domain containing protein [Pandoravirus macleodensis]AVK77007.1 Morn repeat incomplete domain containing protein [Pandoravirus macleodensis]
MVDPADDCHLLALPDELLLVLLAVLSDPTVLACAAPVARRLHALCCDDALWRCLYEQRYGQPVHDHFAEFGKDWRWLYRARATPANSLTPASPGCAIVKPEGHYFCGELRWGVPHGYGLRVRVTLFPNAGDVVDPRAAFDLPRDRLRARSEGHWVRGSRHGRVYHYMPCGDRFEGNFTNGEYHGDGVYFHNSGRVYRGTYNHGERQGPGVEEYPDGRRYEGQWNCKRNGEGTMTLPDGRSHRGRWRAGKPHGWGVHTWPNGQRVEAVWRDGAPRGQGMLATADGRYFIDEAKVVFCLGRVMIPTDADATRKGGDDWGAHLKRIHVTYCADGAHQRTLVIDYIDGSQLLACWDKADLCAHRVGVHSSSCAAADRALSKGDENAQPTTALGTCMACLCDAHERRTQPDEWYFPASA